MTDKPMIIDDVAETDVYVAALEIRSVGTSKNLYPSLRFSHHFSEEPSQIPYSYQTVMKIAEAMGAVFVEEDMNVHHEVSTLDEAALAMEALRAKQTDEGNDTIH